MPPVKPVPARPRVLIVDDEDAIRKSLRMVYEFEGFECEVAGTGPDALQIVQREEVDLVVLDVKMAGLDGLETLRLLKQAAPDVPVLMLSGHGTVRTAVEATKLGAFDFLEKPPETERLMVASRNAIENRRLLIENRRLRRETEGRSELVYRDPAMDAVMEQIRRVARTQATVLVTGESGCGKELIAREIYRRSSRSEEPFIGVNCAAIPEELIESELFGHEKGSFTGAAERQIGKFEMAHRGTIFLDEIGDMSARAQAKVLRVLQEGEVERIGSQKTLKVDVRVIAATNKDLQDAIARGQFRDDLFFRLSVIEIRVPPLRERRGDIEPLARHFVALAAASGDRKPRTLAPDLVQALESRDWRGNVRELRNVIDRLLILSDGPTLALRDLESLAPRAARPITVPPPVAPPALSGAPIASPVAGAAVEPADLVAAPPPQVTGSHARPTIDAGPRSLKEFKEESERAFIVARLEENSWNISATAQAIGTPRSNLYKKLEQYGISEERDRSKT